MTLGTSRVLALLLPLLALIVSFRGYPLYSINTVKPRFNVILVHRSSTVYRSIARNS